jgi:anti-sigma factor RsiW
MSDTSPITEADLHAYVDEQLPIERQREIETYLASRPDEAQRIESYRVQKRELRALFRPVLDEALPQRVMRAARPRTPWYLQRLAAGIAIALISAAAGWGLRGGMQAKSGAGSLAQRVPSAITTASATAFAQRAAVAHAVYSPDLRRAVEIDATHEDQLIAWLSKRMGAPMKPPHLQALGYVLEGGRLLPGNQGPVAQFMYRNVERDGAGGKLTLYVSNEIGDVGGGSPAAADAKNVDTAFRFAQQGPVNVFYWVDGAFGYAISADADRSELARVSGEVYRQLSAAR